MSIELRWIVPDETFIPGREYPKLQYRDREHHPSEFGGWVSGDKWKDVPTIAIPPHKNDGTERD